GVSVAERSYQHALEYAKDREQGTSLSDKSRGVAIVEHADVKRMLLTMKANIEACRALTYEAALHLDLAAQGDAEAQARVDLLTPIVKACGTDMSVEVTSTGVQIHGGMGFVEETGAAQFYRDARILPIYEGTNGIQAMDLAFRKTLRDQGAAAKAYLSEVEALLRDLDQLADAKILPLRHALDEALQSLTAATAWVVGEGMPGAKNGAENVAASSVPYLKCFGLVAGGAMMARSVMAAKQQLEYGQGDEDFLNDKINTARFYATHILPQANAYAKASMDGAQSVLEAKF
ncbi:unnamed protein product, partial [Cyprideis torosa]